MKKRIQESPAQYEGMTWLIRMKQQDGNGQTVYHFGNMFILEKTGKWLKMKYAEAAEPEGLPEDGMDRKQ